MGAFMFNDALFIWSMKFCWKTSQLYRKVDIHEFKKTLNKGNLII